MVDYSKMSDEELITRLREGDGQATDFLMEKYKNLVRGKAGSMYILGGDRDDIIQEGMIGLYRAIRDYDIGRDASFCTFADLCVTRQIYSAVRASGRKKHSPLNDAFSLNSLLNPAEDDEDDEEASLMGRIAGTGQDPEKILIDQENVSMIEEIIEEQLSPFEKEVLELHLTGMVYTEIARVLNRDSKSTDNALQRIRSKLRKAIREK